MGISLEFYAVLSHEEVFSAVEEMDFETLEGLQVDGRYADFSLHITPNDLDLLTNAICQVLNEEPIGLREYLDTEGWFINEEDRGAFLVFQAWVGLVANCTLSQAELIASRWFESMRDEYGDSEIIKTPESIDSISSLIALCSSAGNSELVVVHTWFE